ncbi:MAG: discoidin domain-containing protein, partial [Planctomycetes bacterium]|nr:discoidin domain-containing protein [Planctomycetota bacterium]
GPRPDGTIHPKMVENFLAIGRWLERYGQTIRGTTGGPWVFPDSASMAATRSGKNIYLHLLAKTLPGRVELPGIPAKVTAVKVLTGGRAEVRQDADTLAITLAPSGGEKVDTIVQLTLDRPALDIQPVSVIDHSAVSVGRPAKSNFTGSDAHPAAHCFDNDLSTYWQGRWRKPRADDSLSAWIEVDLGRTCDVGRVKIYGGRGVRRHQLQRKDGQKWITFHEGRGVERLDVKVKGVKTRYVRLLMNYWWKPRIFEIQVFPAN